MKGKGEEEEEKEKKKKKEKREDVAAIGVISNSLYQEISTN